MTRILDYTGNSQERTTTVAELRTLRITGVRDDGYHLLESLFVALDLHDDRLRTGDARDRALLAHSAPRGALAGHH